MLCFDSLLIYTIAHPFNVPKLTSFWIWDVPINNVRYISLLRLEPVIYIFCWYIWVMFLSLLLGTAWSFKDEQLGFWDHSISSSVVPPSSFAGGFSLVGTAWIYQHKPMGFWDHSIASLVASPWWFSGDFSSNWDFPTTIWEPRHTGKDCILF